MQGGGSLKSTSINGVKIYSVSSQQPSIATWLDPKKQRALRKDPEYQQRVELIQDLRFETATTKIKHTPDGEYLIASGIYPPQIKVYELRELSLKFERHFDAEIVNFEILDDDYSKLAFLCTDRSVCLHAKYGKHYSLRIPRMGRDMAYDCWSCDLLCAASSPDVYRINLEQGRFLASLTSQSPAVNVISRSKLHGLVACGGEDGAVECFDMRTKTSVGRLDSVAPCGKFDEEVTALAFDEYGGHRMAVGTSGGKVLLYDLRSSHPIQVKDHMFDSPILDIKWHHNLNSDQQKLITADNQVVRIWDPETGDGMTSIESTAGRINDVCVFSGSGLILLALDSTQIPAKFIPSLGPAPKWCPSLENLTEELEEGAQRTIYDNFKFVTKEDLEKLNLTSLIGTNCLRAYMHGFFIDYRLYKKARDLADPFAYETYFEQRKQEKLEAELRDRIAIKRKLPKINRKLYDTITKEEAENEGKDVNEKETKKGSKKKKGKALGILEDNRFASLFENKDFKIDENSQEYLALHPVASKKQPSLLEEHFEPVMEDDDHNMGDSDSSDASQFSEDEPGNNGGKTKKQAQAPRLLEVKDERHAEAYWNRKSLSKEDSLSLGERVAALGDEQPKSGIPSNVKFGPGGSREISFISRSSAKYKDDDEDREPQPKKKRGVQSLGLKPVRLGPRGGRGRTSRGKGRRGRR